MTDINHMQNQIRMSGKMRDKKIKKDEKITRH